MAYPIYGKKDPSASMDPGQGWFANLKDFFGDASSEFNKQPVSLLASGSNDPYLDPGYQRDLLMQQAIERKKNALRSVKGLTSGGGGQMVGTPKYQHYVPDTGAPIRALSDYFLSKQAIKGGQADETKAFDEWRNQWGPYARGARKRIYGTPEDEGSD